MQGPVTLLFACLMALALAWPANAAARIALVIGNAAYENVSALRNAASDAQLVAET